MVVLTIPWPIPPNQESSTILISMSNTGTTAILTGEMARGEASNVNSIYFLPMNIGGDGKDVWPFAGRIDGKGSPENCTMMLANCINGILCLSTLSERE